MMFQRNPLRKPGRTSKGDTESAEVPEPLASPDVMELLQFQGLMGNRATTQRFGHANGRTPSAPVQRKYDGQPIAQALPPQPAPAGAVNPLIGAFAETYEDFISLFRRFLSGDQIEAKQLRDLLDDYGLWMTVQINNDQTPEVYRTFFVEQRERIAQHKEFLRTSDTWRKDLRALYGITEAEAQGTQVSQIEVQMGKAGLAEGDAILYTQGVMACAALIMLGNYNDDTGFYQLRLLAHLPAGGLPGMDPDAMATIRDMLNIAQVAVVSFGNDQADTGRPGVITSLEETLGVSGIRQLPGKAAFVRVTPDGGVHRTPR